MTYYAVAYMSNGEIHLKPFPRQDSADRCLTNLKTEYGDKVRRTQIIKKDETSETFVKRKGFWIS